MLRSRETLTALESRGMAKPQPHSSASIEIDYDQFVVEDGKPVDNVFSEKQMRLLVETLYTSWDHPQFAALANVGIFYATKQPPIVPDVMVSLDTALNPGTFEKKDLSYFVWDHGKPPEIAIEIVSNREGGEDTDKKAKYAQIGVAYYVIYDPDAWLSKRVLRSYERHVTTFVDRVDSTWLPGLGLGLTLWSGHYEKTEGVWLRWIDEDRNLLPTGVEAAEKSRLEADKSLLEAEQSRLEAERLRLEAERLRLEAEQSLARSERLEAQLRALGAEPE